MFSSGSSTFNRNLEKATSQLLLEPDWDSMLQIVDCIRQGDVNAKTALMGIKKKMGNENPHVAMFALQVLEACVKNCGSTFHTEVATKDCMEFMKDQAKVRTDPVKEKILELIQTWSHAFRNEPRYKAVEDTFHLLKMEGHKFPALREADAMFDAEKAPQWKEGESCTRCRVQFSLLQRKHHCRNCGEIFCGNCSAKTSIIPKLGFEREVRVCDSCFDKINKTGTGAKKEDDLPAEYLSSPLSKQTQQAPPSKSDQEQQEEEELMLALALSKSEHETKEKERERLRANYGVYGGVSNDRAASPPKANNNNTVAGPAMDTSDMDPELARYLNRHYWQQKSAVSEVPSTTTVPSAPPTQPTEVARVSQAGTEPPKVVASSHLQQNGDTGQQEQFLAALKGSLEIFVNRMRSNSERGRPITNDSAVQSLFAVISEMHPQLMTHIHEKEEARSYYEGLQDKLTQLRDAREALDSLREEHREKRRREAEEMERLRQIQMMQKLEVMRQKKHEYLEMQRQLALQRLQEQEREMHARLEQQKQLTHMRQMQAFGYTQQGYGQAPAMMGQGYSSQEGSPVHRMATATGGMPQGPVSGMYPMGPTGQQFNPGYQPDGSTQQFNQGYAPDGASQQFQPGYQVEGSQQFTPGYQPDTAGQQFTQNFPPDASAVMAQQPYNVAPGEASTVGGNAAPMAMTSAPPMMGGYGAGGLPTSAAGMTTSVAGMPTSAAGMPTSAAGGLPSMAPDSNAYSSMAPPQSFNMQGLASSLPGQFAPPQGTAGGYAGQAYPQHYMGAPQQFPQQPPQQQQQQQQHQQLPQQQQPQQPPATDQNEVQLISF